MKLPIEIFIEKRGDVDAVASDIGRRIQAGAGGGITGGASPSRGGSSRGGIVGNVISGPGGVRVQFRDAEREVRSGAEKISTAFKAPLANSGVFYDYTVAQNMRAIRRMVSSQKEAAADAESAAKSQTRVEAREASEQARVIARKEAAQVRLLTMQRSRIGDPDAFGKQINKVLGGPTLPESESAAVATIAAKAMTVEQRAGLALKSRQAIAAGTATGLIPPAIVMEEAGKKSWFHFQSGFAKGGMGGAESGALRDVFRSVGLPFGTARGLASLGLPVAGAALAVGIAKESFNLSEIERVKGKAASLLGVRGTAEGLSTRAPKGSLYDTLAQLSPTSIAGRAFGSGYLTPSGRAGGQYDIASAAASISPTRKSYGRISDLLASIVGVSGEKPGDVAGGISKELEGLNQKQQERLAPKFLLAQKYQQDVGSGFALRDPYQVMLGVRGEAAGATLSNRRRVFQQQFEEMTQEGILQNKIGAVQQRTKNWSDIQASRRETEVGKASLTDDPSLRRSRLISASFGKQRDALSEIDRTGQDLHSAERSTLTESGRREKLYQETLKEWTKTYEGGPEMREKAFQEENPQLYKSMVEGQNAAQKARLAAEGYDNKKAGLRNAVKQTGKTNRSLIDAMADYQQSEVDASKIAAAGAGAGEALSGALSYSGLTKAERFSGEMGGFAISRVALERQISTLRKGGHTVEAERLGYQLPGISARARAASASFSLDLGQQVMGGGNPLSEEIQSMQMRDRQEAVGRNYQMLLRQQMATSGGTPTTGYMGRAVANLTGGGGVNEKAFGEALDMATAKVVAFGNAVANLPSGDGSTGAAKR